jgi:hypothetical protein
MYSSIPTSSMTSTTDRSARIARTSCRRGALERPERPRRAASRPIRTSCLPCRSLSGTRARRSGPRRRSISSSRARTRQPSSFVQITTSTGRADRWPLAERAASTSMAAHTPYAPSREPSLGWLFTWLAVATASVSYRPGQRRKKQLRHSLGDACRTHVPGIVPRQAEFRPQHSPGLVDLAHCKLRAEEHVARVTASRALLAGCKHGELDCCLHPQPASSFLGGERSGETGSAEVKRWSGQSTERWTMLGAPKLTMSSAPTETTCGTPRADAAFNLFGPAKNTRPRVRPPNPWS